MKITFIVVGRLKEKYFKDAVAEYAKRLSAYCSLEIIEVADEKTKENMTAVQEEQLLEKEGARILSHIPERSYVTAFCIDGKQRDSVEMAEWLGALPHKGVSHLVFLIGGSVGLSKKVIQRADEKISFSKLTFPHQLMRVVALEQLYRWYRIMKNEPYHK